jgi:hypothetical protein
MQLAYKYDNMIPKKETEKPRYINQVKIRYYDVIGSSTEENTTDEIKSEKHDNNVKANSLGSRNVYSNVYSLDTSVHINIPKPILKRSSFLGKDGAMMDGIRMIIPALFIETTSLATAQIKENMVEDAAKLSIFAVILNAFYSLFGLGFWIIVVGIFSLALLELILASMKRFREPGIDYTALAKAQVFLGAILLFVAFSTAQIIVDVILYNSQGANLRGILSGAPVWVGNISGILNIQIFGSFFIVMFYCNSIRKMFNKGASNTDDGG